MDALCKTVDGRVRPCNVQRLTKGDIAKAQSSWGIAFRRRFELGMRDPDEMIWSAGFMSPTEESALPGYAAVADDEIQGIVVIDQKLRMSRVPPVSAITYLPYLAAAPWNRPFGTHSGVYRGIGRLLVARAVSEAVIRGTCGRIGLHSFSAARPFYEHLGFTNLGIDPAQRGMFYFELLPDSASSAT